MPVATTTQAGREVLTPAAERILNDRERKRREAETRRADVTTPLDTVGKAPLATVPEPPALFPDSEPESAPAPKPARAITLSTTISYRDYDVTITATGMRLDEFCDMLDKRLGVVNQ